MARSKILLLGDIDHAHKSWESLQDFGDLLIPKSNNRADFIKECRDGNFEGVIAAYRTLASDSITGRFDEELVQVLPKSWAYISNCGAGYDKVDVHACSARDPPIRVSNTPSVVDDATADVNMFLIIGALRNFNTSILSLREGNWRGRPVPALGHDPEGKVLGILGMGGIGRNLKKKAESFGLRVIYNNRRKLSEEQAGGAEYVSFDELLGESDVISLNLPLNTATRHIISKPEFQKMKDGVVIVNTARGPVIDEAALVEALDSGKVRSVGLDVFEEEPKIHPGLINNPNVLLLPHMGTWTVETQTAMEELAIENIRSAVEFGVLKTPVPEQANL